MRRVEREVEKERATGALRRSDKPARVAEVHVRAVVRIGLEVVFVVPVDIESIPALVVRAALDRTHPVRPPRRLIAARRAVRIPVEVLADQRGAIAGAL